MGLPAFGCDVVSYVLLVLAAMLCFPSPWNFFCTCNLYAHTLRMRPRQAKGPTYEQLWRDSAACETSSCTLGNARRYPSSEAVVMH